MYPTWYPDEEWADVPGFEGFAWVSTHGRVMRTYQRAPHGALMTAKPDPEGYPRIVLNRNGRIRGWLVHRLVLQAFVGPLPAGQESCHRDGVRRNVALENLRYAAPWHNAADRARHRTHPQAWAELNARSPQPNWGSFPIGKGKRSLSPIPAVRLAAGRCRERNARNKQCKNPPRPGSEFCQDHRWQEEHYA